MAAWTAAVGPGGLDARRSDLDRQRQAKEAVETARRALASAIGTRTKERDDAETERDAARDRGRAATLRAQSLEILGTVRERLGVIDARLDTISSEEVDATAAREAAMAAMASAKQRQQDANAGVQRLASDIGALTNERNAVAGVAAVAVQSDDAIEPSDDATDRDLLAWRVRDREHRWRGAVTDPELRAQIGALQSAIGEIEKRLADYADVVQQSRALLTGDPTRSMADYRRDAEQIRHRVEMLAGVIGELTATGRQLNADLDSVQAELRALRRPAELAPDEITVDEDEAAAIRDRLRDRRDTAMTVRTERESEQQAAVEMEKIALARVELLEGALPRLGAAVRPLVTGGVIVPAIDVAKRESELDGVAILDDPALPEPIVMLLRAAGRPADGEDAATALEADKTAVSRALDGIDTDIETLRTTVGSLEERAGLALDAAEALLRGASEVVVRGDRIVQTLRAAPRRTLADLAIAHHDDIVQRLTAVRHHVERFDARLEALSDTAYATIADLLREVRRTVRESQLPNTPAMGRWAGADLLQLTGLDTLKAEQRRAAVGATLRGWFDPERPQDRPRRFDSNDVVHELLRAVTPQFTARILIPSDPLDPEHKPVEHLALETSGGEGVTVALILASLLASRRASALGHRRTTLLLDNPFAKVTKPEFLRLARDVADELDVQLVAFTGMRDIGALTVFPRLTQLRVSRRENANFVVPYEIDDDRLQPLLRDGTLYASPTEWTVANRTS